MTRRVGLVDGTRDAGASARMSGDTCLFRVQTRARLGSGVAFQLIVRHFQLPCQLPCHCRACTTKATATVAPTNGSGFLLLLSLRASARISDRRVSPPVTADLTDPYCCMSGTTRSTFCTICSASAADASSSASSCMALPSVPALTSDRAMIVITATATTAVRGSPPPIAISPSEVDAKAGDADADGPNA